MPRVRLLSISLGAAVSKKDGEIDPDAIKSISDQFVGLTALGFKIAAVVGPGGLGQKYLQVARRYSKDKAKLENVEIESSTVNALLLIDVLRARGLRVNSSTFASFEEMKKFAQSKKNWQVMILGKEQRRSPEGTSSRIARIMKANLLIIVSTQQEILQFRRAGRRSSYYNPKRNSTSKEKVSKFPMEGKDDSRRLRAYSTGYKDIFEAVTQIRRSD